MRSSGARSASVARAASNFSELVAGDPGRRRAGVRAVWSPLRGLRTVQPKRAVLPAVVCGGCSSREAACSVMQMMATVRVTLDESRILVSDETGDRFLARLPALHASHRNQRTSGSGIFNRLEIPVAAPLRYRPQLATLGRTAPSGPPGSTRSNTMAIVWLLPEGRRCAPLQSSQPEWDSRFP